MRHTKPTHQHGVAPYPPSSTNCSLLTTALAKQPLPAVAALSMCCTQEAAPCAARAETSMSPRLLRCPHLAALQPSTAWLQQSTTQCNSQHNNDCATPGQTRKLALKTASQASPFDEQISHTNQPQLASPAAAPNTHSSSLPLPLPAIHACHTVRCYPSTTAALLLPSLPPSLPPFSLRNLLSP